MKAFLSFLSSSFNFSKEEAKGILLLTSIIFTSFIAYWFISSTIKTKESNILIEEFKLEDPVFIEKAFKKAATKNKVKASHPKSVFDPNSVSLEALVEMGVPKYAANNLIKYRQKGGKFKSKKDLLRIYGLTDKTYRDLEDYISIATTTEALPKEVKVVKEYKPEFKPTYKPKEIVKFDLNTADSSHLKQIRGIGSVYANRIIKFRDKLGGFHNLNQVKETYGLADSTAKKLIENSFIKNPVKQLDINSADFSHPYLKPYQVKAIKSYRNQHGDFKEIKDLKNCKAIDKNTFNKLLPYLKN